MRVAILGNSGSGKSTLAREMARAESVVVLDLDTVAWVPGKVAVARDPQDAAREVRAFCADRESWIVEGCYAGLVEATFPFQPLLIFLDPGVERCLEHCRARPWEPHKYASRAEQDERLSFLLDWVRDYYTRDGDMSHRAHLATFEAYAGPKRHQT